MTPQLNNYIHALTRNLVIVVVQGGIGQPIPPCLFSDTEGEQR